MALLVETSLASGRDMIRGIARYVREHEPWSIYFEPRSLEDEVPRWLEGWQGDGIIARLQNAEIANAVVGTGLPAVDVLGVVRRPELPLAHVDNGGIARLAADHFIRRGFRHFGFSGIDGVNWSDQRRDAFVAAVRDAGGTCLLHTLPDAAISWEAEQDHLAAWVQTLPHPSAVMACNDPRGQKVLEACRRSGVRVPHEVAVIGVDDDEPICFISDPPLSSIVPNHERVGYEAAALLDRALRGELGDDAAVFIPPESVVTRQSSDVLALSDPEVAEAIYFIRQNACSGAGVDEVCQHVSLSRSTLQRRFRRLLDSTILDELINARIGRAREMLAQTDLPIAQIAERCGFGHQEYLGKVFRERIGQTPAGLRKRARSIRPNS